MRSIAFVAAVCVLSPCLHAQILSHTDSVWLRFILRDLQESLEAVKNSGLVITTTLSRRAQEVSADADKRVSKLVDEIPAQSPDREGILLEIKAARQALDRDLKLAMGDFQTALIPSQAAAVDAGRQFVTTAEAWRANRGPKPDPANVDAAHLAATKRLDAAWSQTLLDIADAWRRFDGRMHTEQTVVNSLLRVGPPAPPKPAPSKPVLIAFAPPASGSAAWIDGDAAYLATPPERAQFLALTSDSARQAFIESFWKHLDRDEHYRRVAYANERFGAQTAAGWTTPRGRLYIILGPPDEIESHPDQRESWRYRQRGETYAFDLASGAAPLATRW